MTKKFKYCLLLIGCLIGVQQLFAQQKNKSIIEQAFLNPSQSAKPWVFWYWMHGAVSKAGITADLEAMKEVGIGGAYLMPIKDTISSIPFQPVVRQGTPEWWSMVQFSMQEAKRLGLQLAMHFSDGFALGGGPWITPELSMQKLVWTKTYVNNAGNSIIQLNQPEANEGFYKDVAVFAYPAVSTKAFSDVISIPTVTTSTGATAQFLCFPDEENKQSFKSDSSCWIQYKYPQEVTCRSVRIHVGGNNYQAQRLIVQSSNDGENFTTITRLEAPRHGWQDTDEDYTNAIPATTARYFRFVYNKDGTEPGAEDLDAAKWKPSFKVMGIYLDDEPVIHQYEAKNGSIWRIAANTTAAQVTKKEAIPLNKIINLTSKMNAEGKLNWSAPPGNWVIVRIGHTSTGHKNETGGAAKGLECDKFNPEAIRLQFNNWFGKAFDKTDVGLAKEVLKVFHLDSWECGSQNWSQYFNKEFQQRRGYDLTPYLLVMTGVPVTDAATSEKVLHDVRQTIAELVNDVFYATVKGLAHEKGCSFSAESVAPTMVSDGLLHYKNVDLPMGEFWLNSPTHDKPNDMLDAISGAHIYGKNIIQAEAFTSVRMNWAEHPGSLKALGDRNFALGINKLVLHVFTHNPWMDKIPGMTLDGVGLYFQRDQTWFKQSKAWIEYLTRCQALLQLGKPVVDIAVFTGEEVPRRSVLPDRLVSVLPGIFGKEKVAAEKKRLDNTGQPQRQIPDGVNHSANMADPEDWIDPLNGYSYDSFNPDVLLQMTVKNGIVVTPGGASYKILVFPNKQQLNPNNKLMSVAVAKKLLELVKDGATVIMGKEYQQGIGLNDNDDEVKEVLKEFMREDDKVKVVPAPYFESSFKKIGVEKDLEISSYRNIITWNHREIDNTDIYFISNQSNQTVHPVIIFNVRGKEPELWNAVTGKIEKINIFFENNQRTSISLTMQPSESFFVIFKNNFEFKNKPKVDNGFTGSVDNITTPWKVQFDSKFGGPKMPVILDQSADWSQNADTSIRYYSGTAIYKNKFSIRKLYKKAIITIGFQGPIYNIATIKVNGVNCGTLWTQPYSVDISKAVKRGKNLIEVEVTNSWHNRLIGDSILPKEKRITWTTAPFRLKGKPLEPAGLLGQFIIITKRGE